MKSPSEQQLAILANYNSGAVTHRDDKEDYAVERRSTKNMQKALQTQNEVLDDIALPALNLIQKGKRLVRKYVMRRKAPDRNPSEIFEEQLEGFDGKLSGLEATIQKGLERGKQLNLDTNSLAEDLTFKYNEVKTVEPEMRQKQEELEVVMQIVRNRRDYDTPTFIQAIKGSNKIMYTYHQLHRTFVTGRINIEAYKRRLVSMVGMQEAYHIMNNTAQGFHDIMDNFAAHIRTCLPLWDTNTEQYREAVNVLNDYQKLRYDTQRLSKINGLLQVAKKFKMRSKIGHDATYIDG